MAQSSAEFSPTEPETHSSIIHPSERRVSEDMNKDDEEPIYYERIEQPKVQARRKSHRRPSNLDGDAYGTRSTVQRRSVMKRMSLIRAQIEGPPEQPEENNPEKEEIRLETIAREGLKHLYERQLKIGKGMQRGPHIVPYRSLGTPDLKRDDSLLPKTFQFAKREKFPAAEPLVVSHNKTGGQPMVLPLELRSAYWNGGRWCGTSSTARQVSAESGFKYLYQEVVESEKRRINCMGGKYFLRPAHTPGSRESDDSAGRKEDRKRSIVSELSARQKTERPSVARPFIPPLPLKDLPKFDLDEQLAFNKEILSAYRGESTYRERLAAERAKSPEYELMTNTERKKEATMGTNGFPLKACEDSSLRQLENILQSKASFCAMQHNLNAKLIHSLKAMQTARPYHYAREFNLKGGGRRRPNIACDPSATPRRANALRAYMTKFPWFEDLMQIAYANNRQPTMTQLFIINDIRRVMDLGIQYGLNEFTHLIQKLGKKKLDMDSPISERALVHVHTSLQLNDLDLVTNLVESRSRLPAYLERKETLVKQVIRDLAPNMFPQSRWADRSKARKKFFYHHPIPKTPPSPKKLRQPIVARSNPRPKKPQITQTQTARF